MSLYAITVDGVRPVIVRADTWIGLGMAIQCDHCKGRRFPSGRDDRSLSEVEEGLIRVEPFEGSMSTGILVGLLAHVAFEHSTLPVRELDLRPKAERSGYHYDPQRRLN